MLAVEILEPRLTPSALNMSWSTSPQRVVDPQSVGLSLPNSGAVIAGTGIALSEQHRAVMTEVAPELTSEQIAAMDVARNEPRVGEPVHADDPFGTVSDSIETPAPLVVASTNAGADDEGGSRADADYTTFRNRINNNGTSRSFVNEPHSGTLGRAVFETGNWYATVSGDNGANFAYVNPYTTFGNVGGGFCCDQKVAVDPDTDQLFWYMQYSKSGSTASDFGGVRIARANGGNDLLDGTWTSWTFTPNSFGLGATGKWMDFPYMSVSENNLYINSNVYTTNGNSFTETVMWRISLSQLQSGGTINFNYWWDSADFARMPAQNATTTMYVASYWNTTSVRIYTQSEANTTLTFTLKSGLNTGYNGTPFTVSPDGNNWAADAKLKMHAVFLQGTTLGMMWHSHQGGSRPYPFIRTLKVNTASAFATIADADLWSSTATFLYPNAAVNASGNLGGVFFFGNATYSASPAAWISDPDSPAFPGMPSYFIATGFNGSNTDWGDYLGVIPHDVYTNTWVATAYRASGPLTASSHQPNIEVRHVWFGRERDTPLYIAPTTDVADTTGTSALLLSGNGSASQTDVIWDTGTGRKDQDIFRIAPSANTRIWMRTSQPTGGAGMDTYLRFFNSAGTALGADDDSGAGAYSDLKYSVSAAGTYYVGITGYNNTAYNPAVAGSGIAANIGEYFFEITTSLATSLTSIVAVTPDPRNSAVSSIDVTFSRTLDLTSFTYVDATLTRNGGSNLLTNAVTITFVSGTTYRINNLASLTGLAGNYVLTVDPVNITDVDGYPVVDNGPLTENWTTDLTAPTITGLTTVSPDPRNASVSFMDVTFSETINVATLTLADLEFKRNAVNVSYSGNESIALLSGTTYRISGLSEETLPEGSYSFKVNPGGIADAAGNAGTGASFTDTWTMDTTPIQVLSMVAIAPDPRNVAVTTIRITFSEAPSFVPYTSIPITRNAGSVTYSGNETLSLVSGFTYDLGGLAEETGPDGNYVFTCTSAGLVDAAGNVGTTGSVTDSWIMDATAPTIVGVFLDGSTWPAAFRAAAGNGLYGYPVQTGVNQLRTMPWSTLNTVYVQFSENVDVQSGDLAIGGVNLGSYGIFSFNYDNATFVAKWVLTAPIDTDRVLLDLDGAGAGAAADLVGNKLAGSWSESSSSFPTTGAAGVDFLFRFLVAVGDVDRNGFVRNVDLNAVRNNLFVDLGSGGYNILTDIDGNGLLRNADLNAVRNHLFVDPPPGPNPLRGGRTQGAQRIVATARPNSGFVSAARSDVESATTPARRPRASIDIQPLDALFADL